ncbi:MAG: 16S rRNA (adenine(1518)-N(6)/adenine(1519)-N(6))-dimethyltransferase RsmA [Treponema sp.]|nr:16S rRNA (adenine(1518)-N(6)/adenine(1519)-N(6))-dimethyltransferase RsmA [Treponema sp.]
MRKKFGQNFLINPAVRQTLVDALDAPNGSEVWEIGPGLGAMTAILLEKGLKVKAFEIDAGFIKILKREFERENNFCLVEGDVLKTWKSRAVKREAEYLFGNLPYNIASAFLADLIEGGCLFKRMVVTVQKEVALRMTASVGSPDYSSFSVLCASAYKVKPLTVIRPSSFFPQPNVDSMAVMLENRNAPAVVPVFFPLLRALFSSRRKTIKNNLSVFCASRFGNSALSARFLQENAINSSQRAEELTPEIFLSLAKSIDNVRL